MATKAELQKRIAELETAQAKAAAVYEFSTKLNAASDEAELLQVLAQPGVEAGATGAYLLYIDLDGAGQPEWVELVAILQQAEPDVRTIPIGTRFYLPEYSLSHEWMANPNEVLLIADIIADQRVDENTRKLLTQTGARAVAIIPLARAGRWVGIFSLSWDEPQPFSQQEAQIYRDFINLATPVVENRRLLVEKERAIVEKLFEMSRGLNRARDADELLRILARPGVEAGANRAYLSYIDLNEAGEPEWVEIVATWWQKGADPIPVGSRFYMPTFPFARLWMASPDEPQLVADVATYEHVDEKTREILAQRDTLATAIIPLAQAGRWVGLISFAWEAPHNFSKQEIEIYRALMGLGTQAVENQRLFQHLEKLVEERTRELKETQAELIRQEKLATLGQLAGGVGHELRSPLGVISNAVYFLQMILPEADETVKEYLAIIAGRVHEAERIVSDLLNLSRIKPTQREEIAVSALVAEVLARQPLPEAVTVIRHIALDLPLVFVDPQQIGQVLTNLLSNAYQAMPDGGELSIRVERGNNEQVHLAIADMGIGMSPETMAKIFEPLFTTKAKGIGLGLTVSKNLVEVNGGSIVVESIEGQGSTFTLILPTRKTLS